MTSQQKRKWKVLLEGWRRFVVPSDVRQLLAKSKKMGLKSITNGTNLPRGGGARGIRKSAAHERVIKRKRKEPTFCFFKPGAILSKIGGPNG